MKYVISLGGSAIYNNSDFDSKFLDDFKKFIMNSPHEFVIIVGGGNLARKFQEKGRELGLPSNELDKLGIKATRINAKYVRRLFGNAAHEKVVENPNEINKINARIIICSGWKPGFSTDYVSVYIAKKLKINEIINITKVDYVYDKEPSSNGALPIKEITWKDLKILVGDKWFPGMKKPFDPIATKNAEGLTVYLISNDVEKLRKIVTKGEVRGTVIRN